MAHRKTIKTLGKLVSCTVGAVFVLAACGGSGGGGSVDQADSFPSAAVCNGTPNDQAPAASANDTGYAYVNTGNGWAANWFSVFGEDQVGAGLADTEASIILCAKVTDSSEVERCVFEQDGEQFTLVLMDATYDIELRIASNANVTARDTVQGSHDGCPFSASWASGESERQSFAEPTEELARTLDVFFG